MAWNKAIVFWLQQSASLQFMEVGMRSDSAHENRWAAKESGLFVSSSHFNKLTLLLVRRASGQYRRRRYGGLLLFKTQGTRETGFVCWLLFVFCGTWCLSSCVSASISVQNCVRFHITPAPSQMTLSCLWKGSPQMTCYEISDFFF